MKKPYGLLIVIIVMIVGLIIFASVGRYDHSSMRTILRWFAIVMMTGIVGVLVYIYRTWQAPNPPHNI